MSTQLNALKARIGDALKSPEPDQVHDLRVALRRFMQVVAMRHSTPKKISRELKDMMDLAGEVRDCDITTELAAKVGASKRVLRRLHRRHNRAERDLLSGLHDWIDSGKAAQWNSRLKGRVAVSEEALQKLVRRLFKRAKAAEKSDKELHPLRIAAKELRYTLELGAGRNLDEIKELQTQLGDINDRATAERMLDEAGASKRVLRKIRNRHDRKVRSFRRYWRATFAGRESEWIARVTLHGDDRAAER